MEVKFSEVPLPRTRFRCKINPLPAEYNQGDQFDLACKPLFPGIRVNLGGQIYQFTPPVELRSHMNNIPFLMGSSTGILQATSVRNKPEWLIKLPYFSNGSMLFAEQEPLAAKFTISNNFIESLEEDDVLEIHYNCEPEIQTITIPGSWFETPDPEPSDDDEPDPEPDPEPPEPFNKVQALANLIGARGTVNGNTVIITSQIKGAISSVELYITRAGTETKIKIGPTRRGQDKIPGDIGAMGTLLFHGGSWYRYIKRDSVVGNRPEGFIKKFNYRGFIESERGWIRPNITSLLWAGPISVELVDEENKTITFTPSSTPGDDDDDPPETGDDDDPDTPESGEDDDPDPEPPEPETRPFVDAPGPITTASGTFGPGMFIRFKGQFYRYTGEETVTTNDHTITDVMDSIRYRIFVNDPMESDSWEPAAGFSFYNNFDSFDKIVSGDIIRIGPDFFMFSKVPDAGGVPYHNSIGWNSTIQINPSSEFWDISSPNYQLAFTDKLERIKPMPDDDVIECPGSITDEIQVYEILKAEFEKLKDEDDPFNIYNYVSCWVNYGASELIFDAERNPNNFWQWFQIASFSNMIVDYFDIS